MNPKAKKALLIAAIILDILITIALLVFSIVIINNIPDTRLESLPEDTFIGFFQHNPVMILICDVLPLALLLVVNVSVAIWYVKKTGKKEEDKKSVSLNDLSEEEKAALKQKILQEMMQESNDSK